MGKAGTLLGGSSTITQTEQWWLQGLLPFSVPGELRGRGWSLPTAGLLKGGGLVPRVDSSRCANTVTQRVPWGKAGCHPRPTFAVQSGSPPECLPTSNRHRHAALSFGLAWGAVREMGESGGK